jgi:hypothetical protein
LSGKTGVYQVLFTGRWKPEVDRKQVEANLQRLFKANPRQVAWFLRGAPIVVKTTDDFDVAERYHKALTDAGLICTLSAVRGPKAKPADATPVQPSLGLEPLPEAVQQPQPPERPVERTIPPEPVEAAPVTPPEPQPAPPPEPPPPRIPPRRFEDAIPDVVGSAPDLPAPPRRRAPLLALAIIAAVLIGVAAWWKLRAPVAPVAEPPAVEGAQEKSAAPQLPVTVAPKDLAQLIRGRWFCLYGPREREEVVFDRNGEFRSLQYGEPDSPDPAARENLEMRGLYWISDNTVIVHVMYMPALERYGQPALVDEHAVIRVLRINERSLVWNIPRLNRNEQPCLHASIELYDSGKRKPG